MSGVASQRFPTRTFSTDGCLDGVDRRRAAVRNRIVQRSNRYELGRPAMPVAGHGRECDARGGKCQRVGRIGALGGTSVHGDCRAGVRHGDLLTCSGPVDRLYLAAVAVDVSVRKDATCSPCRAPPGTEPRAAGTEGAGTHRRAPGARSGARHSLAPANTSRSQAARSRPSSCSRRRLCGL